MTANASAARLVWGLFHEATGCSPMDDYAVSLEKYAEEQSSWHELPASATAVSPSGEADSRRVDFHRRWSRCALPW